MHWKLGGCRDVGPDITKIYYPNIWTCVRLSCCRCVDGLYMLCCFGNWIHAEVAAFALPLVEIDVELKTWFPSLI